MLCGETFAQLIDLLFLQSDLGFEELNFILSGGCSSGIVLRRVVAGEQRRDQCESRSANEEKGGGSFERDTDMGTRMSIGWFVAQDFLAPEVRKANTCI